MSDELELVRAWRRYIEHLQGKHNQKSHGRRGGLTAVERKQAGGGFKIPKPPTVASAKKEQSDFLAKAKIGPKNMTPAQKKAYSKILVKKYQALLYERKDLDKATRSAFEHALRVHKKAAGD